MSSKIATYRVSRLLYVIPVFKKYSKNKVIIKFKNPSSKGGCDDWMGWNI